MNIKVNAQLLGIITGIIVQASALLWYISGLDNSIKNFEGCFVKHRHACSGAVARNMTKQITGLLFPDQMK